MSRKDGLQAILKRHGVKDAHEYLAMRGKSVSVIKSCSPDVHVRGSIQLMKKRKVTRQAVDKDLEGLKYL